MPTPEDFDTAASALADPDAPAEVKAAARRTLASLPAESAPKSQPYTPDISGPTGLDAMVAGGLPTQEQADTRGRSLEQMEAVAPGVAKALHLRENVTRSLPVPGSDPLEVAKQRRAEYLEAHDDKLPTASKRKGLEAPPEFTPAVPQGLDFWGTLEHVRNTLPDNVGGRAQHYYEPGIEQFRRDAAPILGDRVLRLDESSEEYKEYADKLWKDIYLKAKAENRPVVRESYKNHTGAVEKGIHYGEELLGGLGSAAMGAGDTALLGLPGKATDAIGATSKEGRDAVAGAFPMSNALGELGGAILPQSIPNMAGRGAAFAGSQIPGVAKIAKGLGTGLAADAARGAVSGGVQGAAAGAVAQGGLNLAHDTDLSSGVDDAALLGGGLGGVGGLLGGAMSREGRNLRKDSPLGEAEKVGARTSVATGLAPGPRIEQLRDEARAAQIGEAHNPDVQSMLAGRLEEPMVKEGRRMRAGEENRVGTALEKYHQMNAAERQPPDRYLGSLNTMHEKLLDVEGNPLPRNHAQVNDLRQRIREVSKIEAVPRGGGPEEGAFNQRLNARDDELAARRHESVRPGSAPVTEAESTTPGGRPAVTSENTIPDEVTPVGLGDLEMPKGTSIPPPGERPDLHFGRPSARHAEIKKENPSALRYSAADANRMGYDVDQAIADHEHVTVAKVREERANGNDMGERMMFVVYPKKFNAGEFHEIVAGVNADNNAGGARPPDPRITKGTERSIRQDRDQYRGSSPEIPRDKSYNIADEEGNDVALKGYSAFSAEESDKLAALKRKLDLAGVGENPPELLPGSPYRGFVGNAREYGRSGRAPEIDQSLREVAGGAGKGQTLDEIKYARAVADLEKAAQVTQMFRSFGTAAMPTERMSALGMRLRLDPILQFLAPNMAGAGAAGPIPNEIQRRKRLPQQADQVTIDQISRLLGGGP